MWDDREKSEDCLVLVKECAEISEATIQHKSIEGNELRQPTVLVQECAEYSEASKDQTSKASEANGTNQNHESEYSEVKSSEASVAGDYCKVSDAIQAKNPEAEAPSELLIVREK